MLGGRSSILILIAIIPNSRCDDLVPKCSGTFMTNVDRVIALTNHNIVRTELQEGFVKDKNKTPYPAAENMYRMLNDVINTAHGEWSAQSRKLEATNKFDPKIEQLANMLNSATTSVGCSAQLCGDGVLASVACVYDRPKRCQHKFKPLHAQQTPVTLTPSDIGMP